MILTSVSLDMCVFFAFGCFYYLILLLSNFIKSHLVKCRSCFLSLVFVKVFVFCEFTVYNKSENY